MVGLEPGVSAMYWNSGQPGAGWKIGIIRTPTTKQQSAGVSSQHNQQTRLYFVGVINFAPFTFKFYFAKC